MVKITGYALGENVPVKEILKQVDQNMKYIPVDVNILGVGIADGLNIGSQITLAGLNSELISETEMIMGRYEFEVAVTIQNVNAQNVLMLFLIEKKELPFEMPKNNTVVPTSTLTPTPKSGLLYVASSPSGASVYIDGTYKEKTVAGSYQPFYVDAGSHTIKLTMSGYEEYSMTEYVSSSQTKYIYPSLTGVTPTPTPTPASGLLYVVSYPSGASVYIDGTYEGKTVTGSYQPFYVDAGSHTIKLTMSGYEQYSTTEYVSSGQTKYLYPTLTEIDVTPTPTYTPQNKPPTADILLTRVCTGDETADAKRKMGIFCLGDGIGVDCTQSDDPDGYLVYYHWDWGDGDFDDQLTKPYHIYQETGVYLISLTVTDNWGITNTATKEVEVISFEEFFDISPSTPTPTPTPDVGTIWVYSDPAGGSVYVDGNYEGTTKSAGSISISTTTGYHTVEVLKDGYEAYSTSVYVYSGDNECATAYLTAITS
ncbi:MAG: PEGA domain-containing protein [Nitrospiraceae bacterium]|nr:PEGA domain-containing protein [Nitrospiraceae bacterium]